MSSIDIDVSALQNLKAIIGGDTEDLAELVDDFVTGLPEQLKSMKDAAITNDWSALRIAAHTCKSNARDLGAKELSVLCAELEADCKNEPPSDADSQVEKIEQIGMDSVASLAQLDLNSV